jgi:hypothetical protein
MLEKLEFEPSAFKKKVKNEKLFRLDNLNIPDAFKKYYPEESAFK